MISYHQELQRQARTKQLLTLTHRHCKQDVLIMNWKIWRSQHLLRGFSGKYNDSSPG